MIRATDRQAPGWFNVACLVANLPVAYILVMWVADCLGYRL